MQPLFALDKIPSYYAFLIVCIALLLKQFETSTCRVTGEISLSQLPHPMGTIVFSLFKMTIMLIQKYSCSSETQYFFFKQAGY